MKILWKNLFVVNNYSSIFWYYMNLFKFFWKTRTPRRFRFPGEAWDIIITLPRLLNKNPPFRYFRNALSLHMLYDQGSSKILEVVEFLIKLTKQIITVF